jgi:hypothetical protein
MRPITGAELAPDKTVFRLIPNNDRFIPPDARFPNGEAFEPSSEDKKLQPVRVTAWDRFVASPAQVRALRPERGPSVAYGLHVADLVELRQRLEPRLRVVAEPLDPPIGAGSDGHCGIEGLDRGGSNRVKHKLKLDEVAQKAFVLPEASVDAAPDEGKKDGPTADPPESKAERSSSFKALAKFGGWGLVVIALASFVLYQSGSSKNLTQVRSEAAQELRAVKAQAAEKIFEALESSENADRKLFVPGATRHAFVFLGICDQAWTQVLFDGLPPCGQDLPRQGVHIVARMGTKVRAELPSHGRFGSEIGRLGKGEKVELLTLRSVSVLEIGSPQIYWGEIAFQGAQKD